MLISWNNALKLSPFLRNLNKVNSPKVGEPLQNTAEIYLIKFSKQFRFIFWFISGRYAFVAPILIWYFWEPIYTFYV